eukprot:3372820-Alexandrium_andersonii.AAC.1
MSAKQFGEHWLLRACVRAAALADGWLCAPAPVTVSPCPSPPAVGVVPAALLALRHALPPAGASRGPC